ncbi:hypothetical protein ACHAWF_014628 [Thalassiosira exigua]
MSASSNDGDATQSPVIVLKPYFDSLCYPLEWPRRREIFERIQRNDPSGTFLGVNGCHRLTPSAWSMVGQCLIKNAHVTKFQATECQMSSESFRALMVKVKMNAPIKMMDLSWNSNILRRSEEAQLLASHVSHNANINDLRLIETGLDDEGFKILMQSLHGSSIRRLGVRRNRIGLDRADKVLLKENFTQSVQIYQS